MILTILKLLVSLYDLYKYLSGVITLEVFNARLKKIKDGVEKAKDGPLEERLEGGQEVEDNFNNNT